MAKGKPFAPEFRQEAVRLYRVSGRPFRAVGEELGVARRRVNRTLSRQRAGQLGEDGQLPRGRGPLKSRIRSGSSGDLFLRRPSSGTYEGRRKSSACSTTWPPPSGVRS